MSAAPSRIAQRELFAMLLITALLVRPRGCEGGSHESMPAPATAVRERSGRLERAQPDDWQGHTPEAAAAEGPPYCWWAIDEALLGAAGIPAATAAKLLRHMEAGGLPDADALRRQAMLPRPQADRWGPIFRLDCRARDLHVSPSHPGRR